MNKDISNNITIKNLSWEDHAEFSEKLLELLADAVNSGASLGFLSPLHEEDGRTYWKDVFCDLKSEKKILLVACKSQNCVGTVQLALATKPNAMHRAEVQKLIVHTSCRRCGIGRLLMSGIEAHSLSIGRTLLVLDTRQGDAADHLYNRINYSFLGAIQGYAKSSNGVYHNTSFFFKHLKE